MNTEMEWKQISGVRKEMEMLSCVINVIGSVSYIMVGVSCQDDTK